MIPRSIAFHHFGCKVNFSEASALSRQFKEQGFEILGFHDKADIYVISTCVVTSVAEKKCRAAIRQAHRLNPDARIAVIGCFSELKPGELAAMEGVDIVLGHTGKFNLPEAIRALDAKPAKRVPRLSDQAGKPSASADADDHNSNDHTDHEYHGGLKVKESVSSDAFVPAYSSGDRTRSFLKIQDGCDYFCTYCTIPFARGRSRSDTIKNVITNASKVVGEGIREVVLTGVNIGDFGRHSNESFLGLLQALEHIEDLRRVRISSIEPDLLNRDIIEFVAGSRNILPHFHIPLQSGSNRILKLMHRKYPRELYQDRVAIIKSLMPHACIAADVIVGFPGESDHDFDDTFRFLSDLDISYLHVFTYSNRERTLAAKMEEMVHPSVKKQRSDALHQLSEQKKRAFYQKNAGFPAEVLFESDNNEGYMHGFTRNYIRVKHPYDSALINEIRTVILEKPDIDGVFKISAPETP